MYVRNYCISVIF